MKFLLLAICLVVAIPAHATFDFLDASDEAWRARQDYLSRLLIEPQNLTEHPELRRSRVLAIGMNAHRLIDLIHYPSKMVHPPSSTIEWGTPPPYAIVNAWNDLGLFLEPVAGLNEPLIDSILALVSNFSSRKTSNSEMIALYGFLEKLGNVFRIPHWRFKRFEWRDAVGTVMHRPNAPGKTAEFNKAWLDLAGSVVYTLNPTCEEFLLYQRVKAYKIPNE